MLTEREAVARGFEPLTPGLCAVRTPAQGISPSLLPVFAAVHHSATLARPA